MHEAFQCIIIATGVRRQDQIREGLATQAARSRWFWWEEMQHRWVASKVASTFGLWWPIFGVSMCPHMMSSLMYSWNCAGHFATSWHLSWSWIRTFSWLMDMLVWHILLWWSVKWHCAGASTCCTLFNLFQHQNLGIRCTWTRSCESTLKIQVGLAVRIFTWN